MDMRISNFAIIPLFIASFILFSFQYYRVNPERRVLNFQFLMFRSGGIAVHHGVAQGRSLSPVFFLLGLVWIGVSLFLLRFLPPPRT